MKAMLVFFFALNFYLCKSWEQRNETNFPLSLNAFNHLHNCKMERCELYFNTFYQGEWRPTKLQRLDYCEDAILFEIINEPQREEHQQRRGKIVMYTWRFYTTLSVDFKCDRGWESGSFRKYDPAPHMVTAKVAKLNKRSKVASILIRVFVDGNVTLTSIKIRCRFLNTEESAYGCNDNQYFTNLQTSGGYEVIYNHTYLFGAVATYDIITKRDCDVRNCRPLESLVKESIFPVGFKPLTCLITAVQQIASNGEFIVAINWTQPGLAEKFHIIHRHPGKDEDLWTFHYKDVITDVDLKHYYVELKNKREIVKGLHRLDIIPVAADIEGPKSRRKFRVNGLLDITSIKLSGKHIGCVYIISLSWTIPTGSMHDHFLIEHCKNTTSCGQTILLKESDRRLKKSSAILSNGRRPIPEEAGYEYTYRFEPLTMSNVVYSVKVVAMRGDENSSIVNASLDVSRMPSISLRGFDEDSANDQQNDILEVLPYAGPDIQTTAPYAIVEDDADEQVETTLAKIPVIARPKTTVTTTKKKPTTKTTKRTKKPSGSNNDINLAVKASGAESKEGSFFLHLMVTGPLVILTGWAIK